MRMFLGRTTTKSTYPVGATSVFVDGTATVAEISVKLSSGAVPAVIMLTGVPPEDG